MPSRSAPAKLSFPPEGRPKPSVDPTVDETRCGRCRGYFDEELVPAGTQKEWWLCPSCRDALFGDSR